MSNVINVLQNVSTPKQISTNICILYSISMEHHVSWYTHFQKSDLISANMVRADAPQKQFIKSSLYFDIVKVNVSKV